MMRGTPCTPVSMSREIGRLLDYYPRPKWWPADLLDVAKRWAEICGDVSAEQVTQAVSLYLQEGHAFAPKVPQLRRLAAQQRGLAVAASGGSFAAWLRGEWDTPCPVCGATWSRAGRIVHSHQRHVALDEPCHMHCDWVEGQPSGRDVPWCIGRPQEPRPAEAVRRVQDDAQVEREAIAAEGNA